MATAVRSYSERRGTWAPRQAWKVVALVVYKVSGCGAVWVSYAEHAQGFEFSFMQLRRFCQSRNKYAARRLVITLERTRICSYCEGLCPMPTRRCGWVVSVSAWQPCDAGSILESAAFSFLSFSEATSLKYASAHQRQTSSQWPSS